MAFESFWYAPGMLTPDEKRLKKNARNVNSHRVRLEWMRKGGAVCAVCNWSGPKSLWGKYGLVEAHHTLGVGTIELIHDFEHQVPLCPNHHAIAERAWPERTWSYNEPPRTREELVRRLKALDTESFGAAATQNS